jgi:hypothetical protein
MKKKWKRILGFTHLVKMLTRTKDIKQLVSMLDDFAPDKSFISYTKLLMFLKHRIQVFKKEQQEIQSNANYYVLQDPDALKLVEENERIIEEYEWLVEFVEKHHRLITF